MTEAVEKVIGPIIPPQKVVKSNDLPGAFNDREVTLEDKERVQNFTPAINQQMGTNFEGFTISSAQ